MWCTFKKLCDEYVYKTFLNISDKIKDWLNKRVDLVDTYIRAKLAVQEVNKCILPSLASYTLIRKERKMFYKTLGNLKVLEGYYYNFSDLVSRKNLKI